MTFPALIARWALERPDEPAFTDTRVTRTWREFDRRSRALAGALVRLGAAEGVRIAYIGRNAISYYETQFALTRVGAVMVPLNWRLTAQELAFLVADSRAVLIVADPEFEALLPEDVPVLRLGEDYEAAIAAAPSIVEREPLPDDVLVQSYTSGTTSMPKGVLITHRNVHQTMRLQTAFEMGDDTVILAVMPIYHIGGSVFPLFGIALGRLSVIIRAFDPVDLPRQIERYRVTHFNIAPTMGSMIADALGEDAPDLGSIRGVVYGGAPISIKEYERLSTMMGVPLVQMYGMTENGAISRLSGEDHVPALLRSVGRAVDGVEIEIHDPDDGRRLDAGESGEVWVRSTGNTIGYWNRPEATERLFSDGWMRSGDGGRLDENGYLFLTDRISDLIITGGENVYPAEVERVLITHPAVREVAVVGVPDRVWGEAVIAFAVLEDGERMSGEELVDWSRDKLPGFRRPQRVELIPELPRNAAGKLLSLFYNVHT